MEPNIEKRVKEAGIEGSKEDVEVKFGASGAVHHGIERPAFLGQKYTNYKVIQIFLYQR